LVERSKALAIGDSDLTDELRPIVSRMNCTELIRYLLPL